MIKMADEKEKKKEEKAKIVLEREYNVPLRREFIKAPKWKSTQKAAKGLRKFLMKHMKQDDPKMIKIGKHANELLWKHGIKNPPHHIKVTVTKDEKGVVTAELVGAGTQTTKKESDSSQKEKTETKEKKKTKKKEEAPKAEKAKAEPPQEAGKPSDAESKTEATQAKVDNK